MKKNNAFLEKMYEIKDKAYRKLFAKRIAQEKEITKWKILFIVTACILGAVIVGFVVYSILKTKVNKGAFARLKARFSREDDDDDFIDEASDDVAIDIVG